MHLENRTTYSKSELRTKLRTVFGEVDMHGFGTNFVFKKSNRNQMQSLEDWEAYMSEKVYGVYPGGTLKHLTTTLAQVPSEPTLTAIENLIATAYTIYFFKNGGCETNVANDSRGIRVCAHVGVWSPLQGRQPRDLLKRTYDSRRLISTW